MDIIKPSKGKRFFSKKCLIVVHETYLFVKRNHCTFYTCSLCLDIFSGERTIRLLFICLVMNKSKSRAMITCTVRQWIFHDAKYTVCAGLWTQIVGKKNSSAGYQVTTYSCASFSVELMQDMHVLKLTSAMTQLTFPPASANLVDLLCPGLKKLLRRRFQTSVC